MKDRSILFSAPMIRAILEGRKTQTRRIVKPTMTPPKVAPLRMEPWLIDGEQETDDNGAPLWAGFHPDYPGEAKWFSCPYGQPGDRLWVRETWCECDSDTGRAVAFRADDWQECPADDGKWRPSIFMPRRHSRITLTITGVRVEQVQDIKTGDIIAEGVEPDDSYLGSANRYRHPFIDLWNDINAKRGYGWDVNPWVWCITFEVSNA
jgi:hypothetical protein